MQTHLDDDFNILAILSSEDSLQVYIVKLGIKLIDQQYCLWSCVSLKPLRKHSLYFCKLESENRTLNCKTSELLAREDLIMDQWIVSFNFMKGVKFYEIL